MLRSIAGKSPGTTGFSSMVGALAVGQLLSLHGCRTGPGTGRAGPSADKAICHNRGGDLEIKSLGDNLGFSGWWSAFEVFFKLSFKMCFVAGGLPPAV